MYSRFRGKSKTQKSFPFILAASAVSCEDGGEPAFKEGLIKMSKEYTRKRDELVQRYNNIVVLDKNGKYQIEDVPFLENVWTEIPDEFKETENGRKVDKRLKKLSGQSEDIFKLKTDLEDDSFPVIFAGETSSGKSTLINLVIGADILPTHILPCTPVICHIKENERKRLRILTENHTKIFEKDIKSENELKEILIQYLKLDTRGRIHRKCDLVEIHWPMKHLKGVITLVDCPGITDDENMNKKVLQYIPKAVAFVYVINSSNAGGIFKDRIELIWTERNQKEDEGKLPTPNVDCSLIVCNKWDLIDEKEESDVKQYIRHKLDSNIHLKHLKDSNIIEMNAKEAKKESTYNCEYKKFMTALIDVMRESLPNKLKRHEEVLRQIIKDKKEVENDLMVIKDEASKDIKHKWDHIKQRKTDIEKVLQYLNKPIYDDINQIMKHLAAEIRNAVFSDANTTEKAVDDKFRPTHANDMQVAKDIAKPLIKEQIRTHVEKWEDTKGLPFLKKAILEKMNNNIKRKEVGFSEAIFGSLNVNTDIKLKLTIPRMPDISKRVQVWAILYWCFPRYFENCQVEKERKELTNPSKRREYLRSWIVEACDSVTLSTSEDYTEKKYKKAVLDATNHIKEEYEKALKQVDSDIRVYDRVLAALINYPTTRNSTIKTLEYV